MKNKQINIRAADINDIDTILFYDKHIPEREIINSINLNRIYIAERRNKFCGWLRYNLFWDSIPFMNMLYLLENERGKGYGKQMLQYWEKEMRLLGYSTVMTSTQSNEYSQHFYVKHGYQSIGGFLLENDPYELILTKRIKDRWS